MRLTLLYLAVLCFGLAAAAGRWIEPPRLSWLVFNVWAGWVIAFPVWRLFVRPFLRGDRG